MATFHSPQREKKLIVFTVNLITCRSTVTTLALSTVGPAWSSELLRVVRMLLRELPGFQPEDMDWTLIDDIEFCSLKWGS